MAAYPNKDRWVTEYSGEMGVRGELRAHTESPELDWAFNDLRRMGGDLVDLHANYWFFWRGYHAARAPDDQDLVSDGPHKTNSHKTKAYSVFQTLWKTVRPGWRVKEAHTTDPDLRTSNASLIASGSGDEWSAPVDIVAFESADGRRSCLLLANWKNQAKVVSGVTGLQGKAAQVFVTTSSQDMAESGTWRVLAGALRGGRLSLPSDSISILVTR